MQHRSELGTPVRRGRLVAWLLLLGFAVVMWFVVPHGIGSSWRECDTQSIARNFLLDGFDPLHPRVDWRGDTDGSVECEFPLYQLGIAGALAALGDLDAEWPGRLLSLLSVLMTGFCLHRLLEWRTGVNGAIAGLVTFLATGSAAMLATRVVPDGTSLALSVAGLLAFTHYLRSGRTAPLLWATVAVTLAGLQKPLALQVGLVMFGWAALLAPRRLLSGKPWLAFTGILAIVAAWLVHGAHLHAATGLSFGVVSGGDTKFPDPKHLLDARIWGELLCTTAKFGASVLAMAAFAVLVLRRRLDRGDVVLIVATAAGLLVSLRYSHSSALGPQYHSFAAVVGAWLVARAWPATTAKWQWLLLLAAAAVLGRWRVQDERGVRHVVNALPIVEVARAAAPLIAPGELVIARSDKARRDEEWGRNQNCEDPRFFYLARVRGWTIAVEEFTVDKLAALSSSGASLVFDSKPQHTDAAVTQWLAENGELLVRHDGGNFYRLNPRH